MRVYIGIPEGSGPYPGVVVIQHASGVDGFTQDVVHRLFREGYIAAAPELYHRQPAQLPAPVTRRSLLRDTEVIEDVNAALAHLRRLPAVSVNPVGIVGFCMGGRVAYLMAAVNPEFKAAAVFYGGNIMNAWGDGPAPFALTPQIACPLIGFFGADDTNPSPDDVRKLDAELTKWGKPHEFYTYEGAGHAFQNFLDAERYREGASRDSWAKMLAFFQRQLKAATPAATTG